MDTADAIRIASTQLLGLRGHELDLITIASPVSATAAFDTAKVISKLSPLLGNLIEINTAERLNARSEFSGLGKWKRQDPGFPDVIFDGQIKPAPGFEVKAWFPMATEITGRFKDSQEHFRYDQTQVVLLAWLPDKLVFGKPYILDACIISARSVAKARDDHYHNPPDYLVLEPNDTSTLARNLQQTNTTGLKWQGPKGPEFANATKLVESWGTKARVYSPKSEYQLKIRELQSRFSYRSDTNYAKMDRVVHPEIEAFKRKVNNTIVHGMTVKDWTKILAGKDPLKAGIALEKHLGMKWARAIK